MPHIIINDKTEPWRYYTGAGFGVEQTTTDPQRALIYTQLTKACLPLRHRADLHDKGWRVVPADRAR